MGSKIETAIKDFSYSMTIITLVILFLVYQVYFVNRGRLSKLEKHHGSEAFGTSYAARLPVYTDSGLTSSDVLAWGQLGQQACPTVDEANAYLAQDEAFLGNHAPPVFYDIGDVRDTRTTRSGAGYAISKHGTVTANSTSPFARTDQYGPMYYKTQGPDGKDRWTMRTVHCNNEPGKSSSECAPWLSHRQSNRVKGFQYYPIMNSTGDKILRYEPCQSKDQIVENGVCVAGPSEGLVNTPPFDTISGNSVSIDSMTDSDLLYNQ
jgi:hypothetical protein